MNPLWLFLKALDPRIWLGIAIAVAVAASYAYVYRLGGNGPRAELAALQATFDSFKAQAKLLGEQAQREADDRVQAQIQNAVQIIEDYDAKVTKLQKRHETRIAAAAATYARVRDATSGNPSGNEVPAPGGDPGKADAAAAELVACRAGFDDLRAGASADALTLKTLQDLLIRNGHPVQ